jgi:hypothetical protein
MRVVVIPSSSGKNMPACNRDDDDGGGGAAKGGGGKNGGGAASAPPAAARRPLQRLAIGSDASTALMRICAARGLEVRRDEAEEERGERGGGVWYVGLGEPRWWAARAASEVGSVEGWRRGGGAEVVGAGGEGKRAAEVGGEGGEDGEAGEGGGDGRWAEAVGEGGGNGRDGRGDGGRTRSSDRKRWERGGRSGVDLRGGGGGEAQSSARECRGARAAAWPSCDAARRDRTVTRLSSLCAT